MRNNKTNKMQRLRMKRVRLGLLALAALLGLVHIFALVPLSTAGALLSTTGTLIGTAQEADGPTDHRVPSVTEILTRIEPSRYPFVNFLDRLGRTAPAKQVKHIWPELSRYPRSVTVNGATLAGSANASKAVTVDSSELIKANDILIAPNNATDATLKYLVSAVSSTSVTLYALPQDTSGSSPYAGANYGTVPAFADNEVLYWIGNAKSEQDTNSAARGMQPAYKFNYVQTFDLTIKFSDHKMRSQNYGPNDIQRYRRDNLFEFMKNQEYAALFSTEASVTEDPGDSELIWTMAGLKGFVGETVNISTSSGIPSQSQIIDFLYGCFDDNNGAERRILMGGTGLMKVIDKANINDLFIKRDETVAGVQVKALEGRGVRLDTLLHPGFDETGRTNEGVVIDLNQIFKRVYQDTEKRTLELKGQGTDAEGEYYIGKWTLEVHNPDAHKWVTYS